MSLNLWQSTELSGVDYTEFRALRGKTVFHSCLDLEALAVRESVGGPWKDSEGSWVPALVLMLVRQTSRSAIPAFGRAIWL